MVDDGRCWCRSWVPDVIKRREKFVMMGRRWLRATCLQLIFCLYLFFAFRRLSESRAAAGNPLLLGSRHDV